MAVSGKYNLPPSPFTSFFACCAVTSLFVRVRRACLPWTPWEHTLLRDLSAPSSLPCPHPQITSPRPRLPCPFSLLTPWPWTGGPVSLTAAEPVLRPPGEQSLVPAQADPGVDTV